MEMYVIHGLYYCVFVLIALHLVRRVISWITRIHTFRKSMPVVPTLFQPESPFRYLWPKRWQTFHRDWSMHNKRTIYRECRSDIFALVCLFDSDKVYIADPYAVMEMKVTKTETFGRDMLIFSRVSNHDHVESLSRKMGLFGENIVSTTLDKWRIHRRITSRAFSQKTIQLVHFETTRQTSQMMATWEAAYDGQSVCIEK